MIDNFVHVKVIEALRMRKKAVEKSYSLAGWVCFWVPVFLFGIQVLYYVLRLLTLDMGLVAMMIEPDSIPIGNVYFEFNYPPMIACLVFVILGYFAFGSRRRTAHYLYAASCVVFIALSIIMVIKNYEKYTYIGAIVYCMVMFLVCADCIKAYKEDKILSKIDGYPHFNATLMYEEKTEEKSQIRFPDKKSYDTLYEERMEEYVKENPDTQMSQIYFKEKAEREDDELKSWLGGMLGKNEEI